VSIRYLLNLTLALVAAFEVVAFKAFSPGTYSWLAFVGGIAIVTVTLATGATVKAVAQRALSAVGAGAGAWLVVSSLVFAESTVVWLGFSASAAVAAIALAGLTLHEVEEERVLAAVEPRPQGMPVRSAELAS
jgi:hypothetical protein